MLPLGHLEQHYSLQASFKAPKTVKIKPEMIIFDGNNLTSNFYVKHNYDLLNMQIVKHGLTDQPTD
jgi:hypothetical protein